VVIGIDTLYVIRALARRPNDKMYECMAIYTVDESNQSELEGCHRNVPSKRGVHLISALNRFFATVILFTSTLITVNSQHITALGQRLSDLRIRQTRPVVYTSITLSC